MESIESKKGIIIDVREPKEYSDGKISGSINLPSSKFNINQFEPYRANMICLVCQTSSRAKTIQNKLIENGFENVYIFEKHMEDLVSKTDENNSSGWSVDRQFRMFLGLMLALFLVGFYFGVSELTIVPAILSAGLIFTSIIDRCYLRMGIAMLPWNRKK